MNFEMRRGGVGVSEGGGRVGFNLGVVEVMDFADMKPGKEGSPKKGRDWTAWNQIECTEWKKKNDQDEKKGVETDDMIFNLFNRFRAMVMPEKDSEGKTVRKNSKDEIFFRIHKQVGTGGKKGCFPEKGT